MRFYFQDKAAGNFATKCIRVSSTATTQDVIETLAEKFRPDMRMLSSPKYSLYEVHVSGGEYKLSWSYSCFEVHIFFRLIAVKSKSCLFILCHKSLLLCV